MKYIPHQERKIRTIILHEEYHAHSYENDYALLILSSPFKFTVSVDVVCLPKQYMRFDHSRCFATGWGKDSNGNMLRIEYVYFKQLELNFTIETRLELLYHE